MGGVAPFLTLQKFRAMTTVRSTSIAMPPPPPTLCPTAHMLTNNHYAEDWSLFLFVPSSSSGFLDPWVERAVPFKRGTAFFFLMPLMFTGGQAIQRPRPLV